MQQTRSPISSVNQSKRFRRRLRSIFDRLKALPRFQGGLSGHVFPIFLFFLFLFLMNTLFSIRTISCTLDKELCSPEILEKFNKYLGSNVLLLNQKQLSSSLTASFPVQKVTVGFKVFNILNVELVGGNPPLNAQVYLVKDLPVLAMDTAPGSTESAAWPKPSGELLKFLEEASPSGFSLWDTGLMTPIINEESKVKYILKEKPDEETIKSLCRLIKLVNKYLDVLSINIVGQRIFLSQSNQPDIIVNVPFDEGQITEAIKSFAYLASIKKDAKVIDLRFKNPIIR